MHPPAPSLCMVVLAHSFGSLPGWCMVGSMPEAPRQGKRNSEFAENEEKQSKCDA